MESSDKPPPYSAVSPPGQEYHPEMRGPPHPAAGPQYAATPAYPAAGAVQQQQQQPPYNPYQPVQAHPAGRPPPPGGDPRNYGSVTYITQTVPAHEVIIVGGCPACRIGVLEDDFSCLGIFCAIFFFPLGILCCLGTRQRRCPNCGAIFG